MTLTYITPTTAGSVLESISNTLHTGNISLTPISLTAIVKELPSASEATAVFAGRFTGVALTLAIAIAILAGGWIFSKWLASFATRALMRTKMEETAAAFLGSTARYVVVFITIITALSMLGVSRTGMLAFVGALALAIGLAVKDFISHMAAGIMLMVTQPFRVGQTITCGDFMGTVKRITLFNTEINTVTNQRIFMPNGLLWSNTIINHNYNATRQVEVYMRASLEDDIACLMQLFRNALREHPLVRNEPEPFVGAEAFLDNGVSYLIRCWVQTTDFGTVKFSLLGYLKRAMDAHGYTVPAMHPGPSRTIALTASQKANRKKLEDQVATLKKEAQEKQRQKEVAATSASAVKRKTAKASLSRLGSKTNKGTKK